MRWYDRALLTAGALLLAACGHVTNLPINQPVSDINAGLGSNLLREVPDSTDELLVGLAFSGGGMRAAAGGSEYPLQGRSLALLQQIR